MSSLFESQSAAGLESVVFQSAERLRGKHSEVAHAMS